MTLHHIASVVEGRINALTRLREQLDVQIKLLRDLYEDIPLDPKGGER